MKSGDLNMLIGQYTTKISKKGRLALPAKFKKILGNQIIITAGYEKSLMIISKDSFQRVLGQITNRPLTLKPARATDRFLLGSAFDLNLDLQGRFIIPKNLRVYAGLKLQVIFLGIGNRVELWSQENWLEYSKYLNKNIENLAEQLPEIQ